MTIRLCLLVIALACPLPACGVVEAAPAPAAATDAWGPVTVGCHMKIAVTGSTPLRAGHPIGLHVSVRNDSGESRWVMLTANIVRDCKVELETRPDTPVPLTLFGKHLAESPIGKGGLHILRPGDTRDYRYPLSRVFDMSLRGSYTVRASTRVWTGNTVGGAERYKALSVAPLILELRDGE